MSALLGWNAAGPEIEKEMTTAQRPLQGSFTGVKEKTKKRR